MSWQRNLLAAAVLIMGIAGFADEGLAQQSTDTFQVSATVNATCNIVANDLSFGAYDPAAPGDVETSTTLDVTCTNNTSYQIGLDGGSTTADVNNRAMSGPGANLQYALFRDAGRNQNWGNIGGGDTLAGTGNGLTQTVDVYGRLFAGQFVQAGFYSDNVVATIDF